MSNPALEKMLTEMEEMARKATPGPYVVDVATECECDDCVDATSAHETRPPHHDSAWIPTACVVEDGDGDMMSEENARYLASLSPHRVIAMIECIRAAEAACGYAMDEMNEVSPSKQGLEPGRWYTAIDRMKKLDSALSTLSESSHASKGESR